MTILSIGTDVFPRERTDGQTYIHEYNSSRFLPRF